MLRKGMLLLALWSGSLTGAVGAESSSEILERLQKLRVLGSVLYLAAHPDDENTKLIAYWARGRLLETGYLSLTRGSGGQNLIGPELGDELGAIRTHELLQARRIDGGRQLFSRARDFGYSKRPEETLSIWDKERTLEDVVLALRTFRPDVVVTRFSPEPGFTHGHHTAATHLAQEAFRLASDPTAFPAQLEGLEPWQARRLFWNLSEWHFRQRSEPFDSTLADAQEQVGGLSWLRGRSYPELAAESRSQHKSQGFGAGADWGEQLELLHLLAGDPMPPGPPSDPFDGLEIGWSRLPGGDAVQARVEALLQDFQPAAPWRSLEALGELHGALEPERWESSARPWVMRKRGEVEELMAICLGLSLRVEAPTEAVEPGSPVPLKLRALQRAPLALRLESIQLQAGQTQQEVTVDTALEGGSVWTQEAVVEVPAQTALSHPHWLEQESQIGMYQVSDPSLRLIPDAPPGLRAQWRFQLGQAAFTCSTPWHFREVDPVDGERLTEVAVVAPLSVELSSEPLLLVAGQPAEVEVRLGNRTAFGEAQVRLQAPPGLTVEPAERTVSLPPRGGSVSCRFLVRVHPETGSATRQFSGVLQAEATVAGVPYRRTIRQLSYPHIGRLYLHPRSRRTAAVFPAAPSANVRIGYLPGAGDGVPLALERLGYRVETLDPETLSQVDLAKLDTVVLGIRAFNVHPNMKLLSEKLFRFAEEGGTLVVQYTTTAGLKTDRLAPLPLTLSRLRVTDEKAAVRLLEPKHPLMLRPNLLGPDDFEGWVQERGLYFMSEWDPTFTALLGMADAGEPELHGALLVAPYGEGHLLYTGLSLFRQLPAGVSGAYRLLQNLVEYGQHE